MVAAFDFCLHGKGGAAPSIDTAMHGLVDADHVDHLHPDAGIAIATAADGEALTKEIFGDRVVWVPWRRPGFQLGLDIAAVKAANPQAIGVILGGHGITAWGATSEECESHSMEIIRTAQAYLDSRGSAGAVRPGAPRVRAAARGRAPRPRRRARAGDPRARVHRPAPGRPLHRLGRRARLPLPREARATGGAGHLVPRPLPAHEGAPARARPPRRRPARRRGGPAPGAARGLPRGLPRLLRAARRPRLPAHARRRPGDRAGAGCRDVQLRREQADRPGGGRVLRQRDQRDARRRGRLAVRTDRREREVPHRVLGPRGGQARADAEAQAARRPDRARDGRWVGHRQGDRHPARGRGRVRGRRRPGRRARPPRWPPSWATPMSPCR